MSSYLPAATAIGNGIYGGCNDFGEFSDLANLASAPMFNYVMNANSTPDFQRIMLVRSIPGYSNRYQIYFDFGDQTATSQLYIDFNSLGNPIDILPLGDNYPIYRYDVMLYPPNPGYYNGDTLYIRNIKGCSPLNITITHLDQQI